MAASLAPLREGVLVAKVTRLTGSTVFDRLGDWPALVLAGLLVVVAWGAKMSGSGRRTRLEVPVRLHR